MKKKLALCILALAAAFAAAENKAEAIVCPDGYTFCCVNGAQGCFPTFRCFKGCVPG